MPVKTPKLKVKNKPGSAKGREKPYSPKEYGDVVELRSKRKTIVTQAQAMMAKVQTEKRDMSAEEKTQFDKMAADVETLKSMEERIETLEDWMTEESDEEEEDTDIEEEDTDEREEEDDGERGNTRQRGEQRGGSGINSDRNTRMKEAARRSQEYYGDSKHAKRRRSPEYRALCMDYLTYGNAALQNAKHQRALQADVDVKGGYLVLPETLSEKIIKKVDDAIPISEHATVINLTDSASLGTPSLDSDPDDGDWTTEIGSITADSSMTVGKRLLTPHPIRKRLLVSERFLRMALKNAAFWSKDDSNGTKGPENIIVNRLARKIRVPKEKGFMTGTGNNQPLGLFTASTRGISTSADVVTGSTTNITYAGLVNAKYGLKVQYHPFAAWLFSRSMMQKIMLLVDANGRPILDIQTIPNQPDMLLQNPVLLSEFAPNTFTDGSYVGMFGVYEYYYIANSLDITIKQADQLYAESGQIGFFVAAESDGMPVLEEAFVRMKCGT